MFGSDYAKQGNKTQKQHEDLGGMRSTLNKVENNSIPMENGPVNI